MSTPYVCTASHARVEHLPAPAVFIAEFLTRRRPAVFSGAAEGWPAMASWTPQALSARVGHLEVVVLVEEIVTGDPGEPVVSRHRRMRLGEYLQRLQDSSHSGYLAQYPLLEQAPELADDLRFPAFARSPLRWTNVWIGPAATRSHLHFDEDENLLTQVFGRKRLLLVAPEYGPRCYPVNTTWSDCYSPIDPLAPDLARFPRFDGVPVIDLVLQPGDLAYIPRGWWHDVRALEPSISVNQWWWPLRLAVRNLARKTFARLTDLALGTRRAGFGNGYPFDPTKLLRGRHP